MSVGLPEKLVRYSCTGTLHIMSDEKPVVLKKPRKNPVLAQVERTCIVHYLHKTDDDEVEPLTQTSYNTIIHAKTVRMAQDKSSVRLEDICEKIPSQFDEGHGFHKWCYQNFTNVTRLKIPEVPPVENVPEMMDVESEVGIRRASTRCSTSTSSQGSILFPNKCIFCKRGRRKYKTVMEELRKCVTECSEENIKECARYKNDYSLSGEIEGVDLIAREAQYHETCRRKYVVRRTNLEDDVEQEVDDDSRSVPLPVEIDFMADIAGGNLNEKKTAYEKAFNFICTYVNDHIIEEGSVMRMKMLHEKYMAFIEERTPEYYNPNYSKQKLKSRICNYFGDRIKTWRASNFKSELIYSTDLDMGEAVEAAYEANTSENKILQEAAMILRRHIQQQYSSYPAMPWPPSAAYLESSDAISPPDSLKNFLSQVISGKTAAQSSNKTVSLSTSIAEDICSAATQGKWKMPKHFLLGITLHHLTGSSRIITLINRYGHCSSYSQVLELETAMANQIMIHNSILPSNISSSNNKVAMVCFDNFDINEETPSGSGTTHTTHGIIIQEVQLAKTTDVMLESMDSIPRTHERSIKFTVSDLPPCYKKHAEPVVAVQPSGHQLDITCFNTKLTESECLWIICRAFCNAMHTVPDWSGWISKTVGEYEFCKSEIGYMEPIFHPITDYSTVLECIVRSVMVSQELNQAYTFVTMDLAAAKIAYDIQWENAERFSKVVINLGAFHTMCSFMGSIGKFMAGSGFEEIIIEAEVCASGSIEKVMSGKHYNRAMRIHQHMNDALERMLPTEFIAKTGNDDIKNAPAIAELSASPSLDNLLDAVQNDGCIEFIDSYNKFKDEVRQGRLGKTAQYWLAYSDCVWTLMRFHRSIKENDLKSYIYSLRKLCNLLFSADHLHYARYLPVYYYQLLNLPMTHPGAEQLLRDNGFSVARSDVPASRNAVDITIEQTINRSAKTSGGIIGFSRNKSAYHRWCLTRHKRASYVEVALDRVDMLPESADEHKSTKTSEIRRSENEVQKLVSAFGQFMNPFDIDQHDSLFCLSSGKPASDSVEKDLLVYVETGEKATDNFIKNRLIEKNLKFHDTIKKQNLKTFKCMATKRQLSTTQKKTVQVRAERNLLGRLLLLSQEHNLDLEKLFSYPLGPIPWSLATADGGLAKTEKAKLMHHLEGRITESDRPPLDQCIYVMDGNAVIQAIVHLPETFADLAMQIFSNLPKVSTVHFVTDTYKSESIKQFERASRGSSNVFRLGGPKTKLPRDFKSFLANSDNKRQLIQFIMSEWQTDQYACHLQGRQVFYVSEEVCLCLASDQGLKVSSVPVQSLFSSQEEADTRIILHCLYIARSSSSNTNIVVRSPDTDVLIILLAYSMESTTLLRHWNTKQTTYVGHSRHSSCCWPRCG